MWMDHVQDQHPRCSSEIVTCEERMEGHVLRRCAGRRNLPNSTGGVSGNAAMQAERLSSKEPLWAYLSQTHRPIELHCMHYGITLWAYLSEPLIRDSHGKTTIPHAQSHVITHYRHWVFFLQHRSVCRTLAKRKKYHFWKTIKMHVKHTFLFRGLSHFLSTL